MPPGCSALLKAKSEIPIDFPFHLPSKAGTNIKPPQNKSETVNFPEGIPSKGTPSERSYIISLF
ncbi:MAG: hypothetical protein DRI97_09960 [Bacteroidetes bacterium]|nr:MAG: hypothetical protein DRI97_09960 [Bacteroidota bacterium]RLD68752.1 MAG: hypothetical protein DRI98_11445 [Bacteroidota bacterium]